MTNDERPISWMTLEKGTSVVASDGTTVGEVGEVVADRQKDIFSGITLSGGIFGQDRFVPAELIDTMTTAKVHLLVDPKQAEQLEAYEG
ncbi:MAG TPA: DUF2171 domain-containing protein [Actinomycetota bacterium]|nr:DUF2171 domain-containing protein [Actinomycetota bacterium]